MATLVPSTDTTELPEPLEQHLELLEVAVRQLGDRWVEISWDSIREWYRLPASSASSHLGARRGERVAPEPVPEQFIGAAPAVLVDFMLDRWPEVKDAFPAEVRAEYVKKFSDPATVRAICEEFRAASTLDYQQDEADRGNRKIACPVLFLWSQRGSVAKLYDDPLGTWRGWAYDVRGGPVPVGHFIPEEAPEETTRQLLDFLK